MKWSCTKLQKEKSKGPIH